MIVPWLQQPQLLQPLQILTRQASQRKRDEVLVPPRRIAPLRELGPAVAAELPVR